MASERHLRLILVALVLAPSLAHADTVEDARGQFSIDVDTGGLCVVLPPPPNPCFAGDVRALAAQALRATPGATAVFIAEKLDQLELITVVRNERIAEFELSADEIQESARDLAKSAVDKPGVRSASEMTTREERVNGIQMVEYATDLVVDATAGPTRLTWEERVFYGRKATYRVSLFADAANVEDARARVKKAIPTVHLEPARRHTEQWWWGLLGGLIGIEIARRYRNAKLARATSARAGVNDAGADERAPEMPHRGPSSKPIDAVVCQSCDAANELDATFCKKCGTKISGTCQACDTRNDLDAAFCKKCGAKLS